MRIRESGMPEQAVWDTFFDPFAVLDRFGVDEGVREVVEFGCGYGTFSIPAANRISGRLHALDIDPGMLSVATANAVAAGCNNIRFELRDFVEDGTGLADRCCDIALVFNILHVEEPVALLAEARRNLVTGGRIAVMHWNYDETTPRGPPLDIRPRPAQCLEWGTQAGLVPQGGIVDLPPYHYGLLLRR